MTFSPASVDTVVMVLAVISTLAILSVVYRENAFYRLFEHLFVGVATGFGVFVTWRDAISDNFYHPLVAGSWYVVIPMLVATLFYTVFIPKYAWMSRFLISVLFGLGAGAMFRGFASEVFPQVQSSFLSVVPHAAVGDAKEVTVGGALNNIVFLGTLICVMVYFFFSFRHENKVVQKTARTGRWLLMIAFGATFGSTVMARFSLLIDRIRFLLDSGGTFLHWFR